MFLDFQKNEIRSPQSEAGTIRDYEQCICHKFVQNAHRRKKYPPVESRKLQHRALVYGEVKRTEENYGTHSTK